MSAGSKLTGWPVHAITLCWGLLTAAALLLPVSDLAGWMPAVPWMRLAVVFAGWGLDKLVHGTLFGVFAWLAARSARALALGRPGYMVFIVASAYALASEAAQLVVPGRQAELSDLLADLVGVVLGLWLARRILRRA